MFKDLKEFAENDEQLKLELHENRSRRIEMEGLVEDLKERTMNQEVKIRSQQGEIEKIRREQSLKNESHRFVEQDLDTLRSENETLRDRLIQLETDRANLINDKERKDRDCKHLQNEVNRMNSMVQSLKALSHQNSSSAIQQPELMPMSQSTSRPLSGIQHYGQTLETQHGWNLQDPRQMSRPQDLLSQANNTMISDRSFTAQNQWAPAAGILTSNNNNSN